MVKKTWWERWGKIAGVIVVTCGLVGGVIAGAIRISKLEDRAAKVDELMLAMQNLREVLLKNGIEWSPSEFPPVRPIAMSVSPERGRSVQEIGSWVTFLQGLTDSLESSVRDLERRVKALEDKASPFPLVPRRGLDVPVLHPFSVDAGVP